MRARYSKLTVYGQAIGNALESRRLDILDRIYGLNHDVSLLSSSMEAMLDTGSSLSYHDQVLASCYLSSLLLHHFQSPHTYMLLLDCWLPSNKPSLVIPLLTSLIPKDRPLTNQFASDLVEGGARDFFQGVKAEW